ncbi:MAG: aminotransferase class I/II-fold pyridoxal phosphate-dependent enzyme [Bacteroidales bacterium]|nr:aminotransferase class I/II-fold pyridoxal phosphate-dependent enzyme [Bacteroidales bacterium]
MMIKAASRTKSISEYYFSGKLKEIEEMNKLELNVINLGIGSPDLSPSPETIRRLIDSSSSPVNHSYQSYRGISELRKSLSVWYLKFFGVQLNSDKEILPLMGSKEGIFYLTMAYLEPGDEVLVPDPGYPTYRSVSVLLGGKVVAYNLRKENGWYPDLNELENGDLSKVKIMWVNYPHMPTGATPSKDLFRKLVDFGHRHKILICHDNPYSFILNKTPLSILEIDGGKEVACELNSLSKSHNMAGWRIGMLAGSEDLIRNVLKVTSNIQSGMFLPLQHAAQQALSNNSEWFDKLNSEYVKRREVVWQLLDLLETEYDRDQSGIFVWAKLKSTSDDYKFTDRILKEANVFITPGSIFGANGEGYIRVSLCAPVHKFKESIERIKRIR